MEKENYTRKEFSFSTFKRSFTLPENIDAEQMVDINHQLKAKQS
jgi:HSP20 family molecular chaperone IbpA